MSNDDPFTIDLFGNTALSSGLGLGVTAFAGDFDPDDDPDPSTPAPAVPEPKAAKPEPSVSGPVDRTSILAEIAGWRVAGRSGLETISPLSALPPRSRRPSGLPRVRSRRR